MRNRLRPLGRAWGASGAAVGLAVLSHQAAGGHTPSPVLVCLAWAIGAVLALPFVSRRASLVRLLGLLLPAQLVYHLAFGGSHTGHAAHTASAVTGTVADAVGAEAVLEQSHAAHLGHLGNLATVTGHGGGAMLAAHLASAVLSVLIIRHAERGLAAAAAFCRLRLAPGRRLPRLPAPRRRAAAPVPTTALPRPHLLGLPLAALRHRGPPLTLA